MCLQILTRVYVYPFMTLQGSPGQNRERGNICLCPPSLFLSRANHWHLGEKNHCFCETLPCLIIKSYCQSPAFVALQTAAHFSKPPLERQYTLLSNSCQFISLKWVLITESLSGSCVLIKDYSIKK